MGMFDEIAVPLEVLNMPFWPKPLPAFFSKATKEIVFQTKDFDSILQRYTIHPDLSLTMTEMDEEKNIEHPCPFYCDVTIYTSNICAAGPYEGKSQCYTIDGVPAETIEYHLRLTNGVVTRVTRTEYTVEPARDRRFVMDDWARNDAMRKAKIEERAYQIYLQRSTGGDALSDWLSAEKQIRDEEMKAWFENH